MGLDILSYYQDSIANETLLSTAQLRDSALKWCYILGYVPKAATPSRILQVFVLSKVQDTDYTIPAGTAVKTQGTLAEEAVYFETVKDLVIPAGKLGNEKDDDGKYLYAVEALQGVSITNELLGSSTGLANQQFTLKYTPVILDSIHVYVDEGNGFIEWNRVDNFIDSSPTSKHYRVIISDNNEGTIIFGDGNFGKIPEIYTNGLYCSYRTGGGVAGNVGANKVTAVDSPLALVAETFNPDMPIEYGVDKESLASIKVNAPNSFRAKWGALTYDDFGDIVEINIPEVKESVSTGEGFDVDIYVILKNPGSLTPELNGKILSLFAEDGEGRKIVSAGDITVNEQQGIELKLSGAIKVTSGYDKVTVINAVKNYVTAYFAPGNYSFNTPLILDSVSSSAMQIIPGIDTLSLMCSEKPVGVLGDLSISPESAWNYGYAVMTPGVGEVFYLKSLELTDIDTLGGS